MKNQAYKLQEIMNFLEQWRNRGFKVQYMPNGRVYGFRKGKK